jgi:hypothetical protein
MADTVTNNAILQRFRDVFLTNNIIKSGGSPFAIEGLGHGSSLALGKAEGKGEMGRMGDEG